MVEVQNIWRRRKKRRNFFEKLNMHWITKLFLPYFLLPFEIWYFFALGLNVAQFMHNNEGVLLQSFTLLMLNLACGLRTLGGKRVWERTREFCFESKCLKNLLPWLWELTPSPFIYLSVRQYSPNRYLFSKECRRLPPIGLLDNSSVHTHSFSHAQKHTHQRIDSNIGTNTEHYWTSYCILRFTDVKK